MHMRNMIYIEMAMFIAVLLGIVIKTGVHHRNIGSELTNLRINNLSAVKVRPVINPNFSGIWFDQNQTVRLVHALNNGVILPDLNPDKIVSLEITLNLSDGKQITVFDSGDAEFLVTSGAKSNPQSYMIASTDLKELLLPYQELFKREISLKRNIALYGTDRLAGIVLENTPVRENTSSFSEEVFTLQKGNLIRTLAKKTSHGVEWTFIDTVAFDVPNPVGWIESTKYTTEPTNLKPNEGFLNHEVDVYSEPSENSSVLERRSGQLYIIKRVNGWADCGFPGGAEGGWVRETDISYMFPADYDMGY